MKKEAEHLEFDSHNGMSRIPLFWGVPIFPLLLCFVGTLVFGVSGFSAFGGWGGLLALPFLLVGIALRIVCEKDDKYLRRLHFMLRRLRLNRRFGKSLFVTPQNPKWSQYYGRRYAKVRFSGGD
ncbi:VirB3 family type IV secretion system protein [Candidatus Fukatsuia symbiotica]|uniref:VirB3 family type IV secretion system protein n=1 Tax=Candidatus Fukatsuia symbiotica TaxID=1878942 RepID=UPI002B24FA05|nr:VirB3 family type IV secretion system protein [Candidatus Fukatsuia symbiotica]MEA9446199.1 VirB3 family type IV secretion system protein [Candidatus Fukatsuia symbiotica]